MGGLKLGVPKGVLPVVPPEGGFPEVATQGVPPRGLPQVGSPDMGMEIDFYFGRTVFMEKRSYISILV
jgi:hypothetical protein